jgi:myo-inositol 2-dehydrogenase/D-chiro-inositol 1-dehydrogenase
MLTNKEIEAIVIITSTDQHADQIIMAVEAGYHVFCEKPLAINLEDCYKVEKVVEKHPGQITMLGFVRRYDPSYADAKAKLDEGLVGSPFFVRSQTVDKDVFAPFQIEYCTASGGMFHDFSVHDIDLAHWFLGSDIKNVWSLGGAYRFKEFGEAGDADNVFAMCEFKNGTTAVIAASRVSPFGHNTFTEIKATEGNLKVGDPPRKNMLEIADVHGVRYECLETFFDRFKGAFLVQIQDFVDCVLEGKQPALTMQNATKATLVANALTLSFREKRLVSVDELISELKE